MELEKLVAFVSEFATNLPRQIGKQLADVEIVVCATPEMATAELNELLETEDNKPIDDIVADCKGVFIGEQMERDETADEEGDEFETVELPNGVIVLVAANIASTDEAVLVLLHEIGHAMGMDEEQVKALGLGVSPPVAVEGVPNGNGPASPTNG